MAHDDTLATLKLRRRLSQSVSTVPGKPDQDGLAAPGRGPLEQQGQGAAEQRQGGGLISAHRPAANRWDSAISHYPGSSSCGQEVAAAPSGNRGSGKCREEARAAAPPSPSHAVVCDSQQGQEGLGSASEAEGVRSDDVAPTQPKPFLRRKSQAVVPQKLPDWSRVRPRTRCHLDADLLPNPGACASSGPGGSASRCGTPRAGGSGGLLQGGTARWHAPRWPALLTAWRRLANP
jgi:hypothetical protein